MQSKAEEILEKLYPGLSDADMDQQWSEFVAAVSPPNRGVNNGVSINALKVKYAEALRELYTFAGYVSFLFNSYDAYS